MAQLHISPLRSRPLCIITPLDHPDVLNSFKLEGRLRQGEHVYYIPHTELQFTSKACEMYNPRTYREYEVILDEDSITGDGLIQQMLTDFEKEKKERVCIVRIFSHYSMYIDVIKYLQGLDIERAITFHAENELPYDLVDTHTEKSFWKIQTQGSSILSKRKITISPKIIPFLTHHSHKQETQKEA